MNVEDIIIEIKKRGLTAYRIAEFTGLSQVGIDKILNGTTLKPTKRTIEILKSYLDNSYSKDSNTIAERNVIDVKEFEIVKVELKHALEKVELANERIHSLNEQLIYFKKQNELLIEDTRESRKKLDQVQTVCNSILNAMEELSSYINLRDDIKQAKEVIQNFKKEESIKK